MLRGMDWAGKRNRETRTRDGKEPAGRDEGL